MKLAKTIIASIIVSASMPWSNGANASPITGFISAPGRADIAYDTKHDILYISGDSSLRRYDVKSQAFLTPIMLGGKTMGMDISPDGKTLAVANAVRGASQNYVDLVNLATGVSSRVGFNPNSAYEGGTYTVAYDNQGKLLVSSQFQGSGWTPLRKYDPVTQSTTILGTVTQDVMLTASADRSVIGVAEANISDGRWGVYHAGDTSYVSQHQGYAPVTGGTGWFNFEIGVSRNGSQFVIPTYGGTYVGDAQSVVPTIGQYAGISPIGVAYSPLSDVVYFPFADTNYIGEYDTKTLTEITRIPVPGYYDWPGNWAFVEGRSKVASDGSYLFSTLDNGVFIARVPEPATTWLIGIGLLSLVGSARRRLAPR